MNDPTPDSTTDVLEADWQRRVVGRSLRSATERSVDRGYSLILAAQKVIERSNGADVTVQEIADEAGQSLRTLYQYFESKDDLLLAVFEEAMRIYARMITEAVADLSTPLERLGGVLLSAVLMPEFSRPSQDRGLSRLRLKLAESEPDRVADAQRNVAGIVIGAVRDAVASGDITNVDPETSTFTLMSMNTTFITAEVLGNDAGMRRPTAYANTLFCLRGLGASVDEEWLSGVEARLRLPVRRSRNSKKTAPKKSAARNS